MLWLDRNLGAGSVGDPGDYYQWGRANDGHQNSLSTVSSVAIDDAPFNKKHRFVMGTDWWSVYEKSPVLWGGYSAVNNPCPLGWRLPTEVEVTNAALTITNLASLSGHPLKFAESSYRDNSTANLMSTSEARIWMSDISALGVPRYFKVAITKAYENGQSAMGIPVRCVAKVSEDRKAKNSLTVGEGDTFPFLGIEYGVVKGDGGELWLDRNLGALNVSEDGDFYQWGRKTDDHEKRNSSTATAALSSASAVSDEFIINTSPPKTDWLATPDDNLWQGSAGVNNPCPEGWKVPTDAQMIAAFSTIAGDASRAATHTLKVPNTGLRDPAGNIGATGYPYLWTSSVSGAKVNRVGGRNLDRYAFDRITGVPVRCIQATVAERRALYGNKHSEQKPLDDTPDNWRKAEDGQFILYKGITYGVLGLDTDPTNNLLWMDRNLGAKTTDITSKYSYGDYYQWGRMSDGHEHVISESTSGSGKEILNPYTPNSKFIRDVSSPPTDVPYQGGALYGDFLWRGVNGRNNPCPSGWRLPTFAEANRVKTLLASAPEFNFSKAGMREGTNPNVLVFENQFSYFWSSDGASANKRPYVYSVSQMAHYVQDKYRGVSVRCVTSRTLTDRVDSKYAENGDTFDYLGKTYGVVKGDANELWLDRNLGASTVLGNGDYYQWGRRTDGHQIIGSANQSAVLTSYTPENSKYVTTGNNWTSATGANLWQGEAGLNNPCPPGWRLPTYNEISAALSSTGNDPAKAKTHTLKVPFAGIKVASGNRVSTTAPYLWTNETPSSDKGTRFGGRFLDKYSYSRVHGVPVRCMKN